MKLSKITESKDSLQKLAQTNLPAKVAYMISKLINKINPDLKIYEEQRSKLVKKHGECIDKENDVWNVIKKNEKKFYADLDKLLAIEVDIGFSKNKPLKKIKIEELGDITLTAADFVNLDWLFE